MLSYLTHPMYFSDLDLLFNDLIVIMMWCGMNAALNKLSAYITEQKAKDRGGR